MYSTMCDHISTLAWGVVGLLLSLGHLGSCGHITEPSSPLPEDALLKKSYDRFITNSGYLVPHYLQKMYHVFETIPGGSKLQDLTIHALKPTKVTMKSGESISYQFRGNQDLLKDHLTQVELVLSQNDVTGLASAPPIAVNVCWNKVFCLDHLALHQEEEFQIGDITKLTKAFFSQKTLSSHKTSLNTISVTITYRGRLQSMITQQPIVTFHSVSKQDYALFMRKANRWLGHGQRETNKPRAARKRRDIRSSTEPPLEYTGPCSLHRWEVQFSEIGWADWIIMPEQFISNLCVGSCNAHVSRAKLSKHAYVRHTYITAYNGMPPLLTIDNNNIRVPEACCVPVKYDPVSTLVLNKDNTLTLKRIDEAIATSCGCL